jgi:hypothetical protein
MCVCVEALCVRLNSIRRILELFNFPLFNIGIFVIEVGMIPYPKHALESRLKSHTHKFSLLLIRDAFPFLLYLLMCHCVVRACMRACAYSRNNVSRVKCDASSILAIMGRQHHPIVIVP